MSGEGAAAHALHEKYYPAAAAFLRKLGARPDEMEDACQEVFLQFFRYLPSFRGEAQIKTWLFRLCISEARRARRRRRVRATLATLLGRELPQEAVVPPATASEATLRRRVESGLDRLSEGHRLVFVLLEMEGLPANQVAELARCSEATVWRRVGEVRRRCREMLGLGSDRVARRGVGMRSLRDESESAAERMADVNRAFEPAPGEQAAAWARLQRAMQSRWSADRARAERRRARRAGWRLLRGAGALATLGSDRLGRGSTAPDRQTARAPIARRWRPRLRGRGRASTAPLPDRRAPLESTPRRSCARARASAAAGRAGAGPLVAGRRRAGAAGAAGRGDGAVRVRPRVARGLAAARPDRHRHRRRAARAPTSAPSGGGASAAPPSRSRRGAAPSRVEVQVASYRLEPDSGRFSVSARGEKIDVVVHSGKLAVWSSRRLLATVVAGQRWTNLSRAARRARRRSATPTASRRGRGRGGRARAGAGRRAVARAGRRQSIGAPPPTVPIARG